MDDGPVYPPNIQPAAPGIAKWTTAVYPARCRACLTAVVEGDRIGYDPEIGWLCQHCAGAA